MTNANTITYQNDRKAKHYRNYTPIFNYEKRIEIGKYGELAKEYLKENAPMAFEAYSKYDEFNNLIAKINDDAIKMLKKVKVQLKKHYKMPQTNDFAILAEHNQFIESKSEEIVLNDIVYKMHISDDEVIRAKGARHGRMVN